MMKNAETFKQEILGVLTEVNEMIAAHGGNVTLVDADVESGRVTVRLEGACVGCPMSDFTLKFGVEEALHERIPEVREVIAVE